jgi:DNA-binding NarL/FixJ family response regulator
MQTITNYEKQIIKLMADGLPTKIIKDKIGFSECTIETYKYNLYRKLGVRNGCECVAVAIRSGIIQ